MSEFETRASCRAVREVVVTKLWGAYFGLRKTTDVYEIVVRHGWRCPQIYKGDCALRNDGETK